jgi:hypothetical protein
MASNLRRTVERDRARDAVDAADRAAAAFAPGLAFQAGQDRPEVTPAGAHRVAREMLASLALPRLGRAYPLAYSAARSAAGVDRETVAAELGYSSADVMRVYLSRARKAVPSAATHAELEHADLLGITAERETAKHGAAPLEAGERYAPDAPAPVKVRAIPGGRKVWNGETAAAWTRDLPPSTRARLRTAAMLNRERVAKRAAAEHAALKAAAE